MTPRTRFGSPALLGAALLALGGAAFVTAQARRVELGAQPDGSFLVSSNQTVTPIGVIRRTEGGRPKDAALSPDGKTLAVLMTSGMALFSAGGTPTGTVSFKAGPLGVAWAPDGQTLYASESSGKILRLQKTGEKWANAGTFAPETSAAGQPSGKREPGNPQVTGLAVSPDGKRLYAALSIRNAVAVLDLPDVTPKERVPVGVAPYRIALSPDGRTLFVANRGGEKPDRDDKHTAPSAGTQVRVDPKTDAALRGSLSFIDTETLKLRQIPAGRQPSGMAGTRDGRRLYVANSDEDTVSIVDVRDRRIRETISVRPPEDPGFGQIPTDVVLSGDEKTLFVACGGGNAVARLSLGERPELEGFLPAGWFPIALAARDGQLFVASSKGVGSRPERRPLAYGVHASVGTVQFIPADAQRDLASHTRKVAANNRWGAELPARAGQAPVPVPERVGEPSVFKHVVYLIKENHTFDSTLGDMPEGNGAKELTLFGENVTPNQHALARQFVLLDNTYTSGTNSADGHQWTDSAVANGYMEQNYSAAARSYPYDGGDPLAYSPEGFLWTAALKKGLSVRVYGEFVNRAKVVDRTTGKRGSWSETWQDYKAGGKGFEITAETDNAALRPILHPRVIGFPLVVSDQWRASQYLEELKEWERTGDMPALTIHLLPNDHTSGTSPGSPTPRAMVADNDLATGRIVEAISRSRFWKDTLILVIEDDSQLGLDHVDGHRTIAFCASAYTRRGAVVSEPYNHTSFLRTMELVLGLPAMSRFDRTATPLTACFTRAPDLKPFEALPNKIPLDEMNPRPSALKGEARRLAEACARLDWSDVDRADATTVARAVWGANRPGEPFPWHAFHPNKDDDDD